MISVDKVIQPKVIGMLTASAMLAGCYTMPDGGYPGAQGGYGQGGGGYSQGGNGQGGGQGGGYGQGGGQGRGNGQQQQQQATVYVDGCWTFTDNKGRRLTNRMERLDDNTILVTRVGSNRPRQYNRLQYGLYQDADGSGTYQITNSLAVWRSNNSKNQTFRLTYRGNSC